MISAAGISCSKGFPFKNCLILFVFLCFNFLSGQSQNNTSPPFYEWYDQISTGSASATSFSDIVISIATDSKGNIFLLTFGDGIKKYDPQGNFLETYIPASSFNDPVDLEFNSSDDLYVADLNDREVKYFDSNGNYDASKNISSSYYKPYGIAIDNSDNIYVAEYNDGSGAESTPSSRIQIIYTNGQVDEIKSERYLEQPYRLDVDSYGYIYVACGGSNPLVRVFGPDGEGGTPVGNGFAWHQALPYVRNAGSIVIDDENFVHIIDYAERIRFVDILKYEVNQSDLSNINEGINNDEFKLRIFKAEYVSVGTHASDYIKDYDVKLELPLDIAFNSCASKMYVNDSDLNYVDGFFWFTSTLDFELEFYDRTPNLDKVNPTAECIRQIEIELVDGVATIGVEEVDNGSSDNCAIDAIVLSKYNFTQAGTETITMTVTDTAGNQDTCTVEVTVTGEEIADQAPIFSDCPSENITRNNDSGECGAVVTFPTPSATDEDGSVEVIQTAGLASGSEFPVGTTTVTFSATDEEDNTTTCTFSVIVIDNEDPTISCPDDILETVAFGNNTKQITYTVDYNDNCEGVSFEQTAGLPSGSEFPLGDTINTFIVTDDAGNTATCNFTVTIEEEPDTEDPVIDCPDDVVSGADPGECGAIVNFQNATATDNSGSVSVNRIDNTGYSSGDLFPVGTTTLEFQATDEAGNTSECSFEITIIDGENPEITCPSDISETVSFGEEGKVIEYDLPVTDDNCSGETYTRIEGIASGDVFPVGTTLNVFEVTDASGNTSTCSFNVTIEEAEDTEAPVFDCPEDPIIQSNSSGSCSALVDIDIPTATDNSGDEPTIRQVTDFETDGSQDFPVGDTTVIFEAEDAAGNTSSCEIIVRVIDNEDPQMDCVSNLTINLAEGETRTLSPEDLDNSSQDNCGITDLSLSKNTFTDADEGIVQVILTAVDEAGNTNTCEVSVEVIVNTQATLSISCPGEYDVYATENCQYVVPDFSEIVQVSPEGATIEQSIPPGNNTITHADPFITITATYEGQTETCDIYLLLQDEIDPEIGCPADKSISLAEGETYTLPDYRSELVTTDNCEIDIIEQQPSPGSVIEEDTEISFTVTDASGNSDNCSFLLQVLTETELGINCPEDRVGDLDENCSFELPDYRTEAELINGEGSTITQTPQPGTLVTGSAVEVSLRAENDEQFAECSFFVDLQDNVIPQAICRDYEIVLSDEQTVQLDPDLIDNGSSDNCGDIELSLDKTQFTAADEGENIVTLSVTDLAGNVATCEASVLVMVSNTDVNQQPVPMDEEYTTAINTPLNVSAEDGVLVNDTDPDGDELTAILETPTEFGSLQLNSDGSFSYTPDEGFTGQDFFTYQASDGELTSDVIFVSINVVDETADFSCNSQVVVQLDEEGRTEVDVMQLYQGNSEGLNFSVSKLEFTCEDLGETSISLEYSGRLEGSCEIKVMVMDQTPPELSVRDISIDLDLQGNASISFEDIDNGSSDNCEVEYSLSQSNFTCKNLGVNNIEVTAEDSSGNKSTAFVNVEVFAEAGICSEILPGSEYIFLYPNPTSDSFKVATPGDVTIQRIEIFDNRGRFITARDFDPNETEYSIDLMPMQEAVYVLKIETNEGMILKRLIYKR